VLKDIGYFIWSYSPRAFVEAAAKLKELADKAMDDNGNQMELEYQMKQIRNSLACS
jgi:hypothetical protein